MNYWLFMCVWWFSGQCCWSILIFMCCWASLGHYRVSTLHVDLPSGQIYNFSIILTAVTLVCVCVKLKYRPSCKCVSSRAHAKEPLKHRCKTRDAHGLNESGLLKMFTLVSGRVSVFCGDNPAFAHWFTVSCDYPDVSWFNTDWFCSLSAAFRDTNPMLRRKGWKGFSVCNSWFMFIYLNWWLFCLLSERSVLLLRI